jgi:uncharacterized protein (TIGR03435 family)
VKPLTAFIASIGLMSAQSLEFEVASVKPSQSGSLRGGCHGIDSRYGPAETDSAPPLGRCVITGGRLSHLINIAYDLHNVGLIKGAADWEIRGLERFDIEAKAEDPSHTTEAQLRQMLQALLADRFKIKFHRETKDVSGFALVVARNGPKLKLTSSDQSSFSFGTAKPLAAGPIALTARKYSTAMLANLLSQIEPGPVIDQTGLDGFYDLELAWNETDGPSLFTVLKEQLGLQLDPRKVPVSFFVIESAEKPTGN